jgi:hypothetical protein
MDTCGLIKEAAEIGRPNKIQCQACLVGRYVTLKIVGDDLRYTFYTSLGRHEGNILIICDVVVFARENL